MIFGVFPVIFLCHFKMNFFIIISRWRVFSLPLKYNTLNYLMRHFCHFLKCLSLLHLERQKNATRTREMKMNNKRKNISSKEKKEKILFYVFAKVTQCLFIITVYASYILRHKKREILLAVLLFWMKWKFTFFLFCMKQERRKKLKAK